MSHVLGGQPIAQLYSQPHLPVSGFMSASTYPGGHPISQPPPEPVPLAPAAPPELDVDAPPAPPAPPPLALLVVALDDDDVTLDVDEAEALMAPLDAVAEVVTSPVSPAPPPPSTG